MIKTVILNGSEIKVSGPDGDNAEIHNFGMSTVYASNSAGVAADADNVIAIPSGALDGLTGTHGTVYLLGTGKVQVNFTDEKITKTTASVMSAVGGGDGSGASWDYVDEKDRETLAAAKNYADTQNALSLDTAKEYSDSKNAETLGASQAYADEKTASILDTAKEYADGKSADILNSANEYADGKSAEVLAAAKEYADALNAFLAEHIGYTDRDIFGVEVDFENNIFTRLAGAFGKSAGSDFNALRAYGGRRRCNLSDDGTVNAYFGDRDFKTDGSNGQVMVEQPRFYYKVVPLKTEKINGADGYHLRKARYYVSDTPREGFKVHPAFVRGGVEVDKVYMSAFEAGLYDIANEAYVPNDPSIKDYTAYKLSCFEGCVPTSGQSQQMTRPNARQLAHNRGKNWELATVQMLAATQLLFIIEYAFFNAQTAIGAGITRQPAKGTVQGMPRVNTGSTASLGDSSGVSEAGTVSYRGEENLWGNICTYVDGLNHYYESGEFGQIYITDHDFTDSTGDAPYTKTGLSYCAKSGAFISAFAYDPDYDYLFIPSETSGDSALPVGDVTDTIEKGWCATVTGGTNNLRTSWIGLFYMGTIPSTYRAYQYGARISYMPLPD
ncbi:MAG: hypothetical protein HDT43_01635 [Ruminococcaceae bacterium]|nr:hypothetical protein [Oscillospiraceae bacterium]